MMVHIEPVTSLEAIDIPVRGEIIQRQAKAIVSNLPIEIAHRELKAVSSKLSLDRDELHACEVKDSPGPGNIVMVELLSENICEMFTAFGEKGLAADRVPLKMIKQVQEYIVADVPVGRYLADQLMVPMAMASGGSFRTLPLSMHAITNIDVIKKFLDISIEVNKVDKKIYDIEFGKGV